MLVLSAAVAGLSVAGRGEIGSNLVALGITYALLVRDMLCHNSLLRVLPVLDHIRVDYGLSYALVFG